MFGGRHAPGPGSRRWTNLLQGIAPYFGPVEGGAPGIAFGDHHAGERIGRATEEASVAQRVVPGILVSDRGDDGFREIGARDSVDEYMVVIAAVTRHSLAEFRIGLRTKLLPG